MSVYHRSRLIAAANKFNNKEYFKSHEILEEIWFDERSSARDFYQGLLHAATAFYHLTKKNNHKGTILQLEKALIKLEKFDTNYQGIDIVLLKKQLLNIYKRLKKKEVPKRLPKIIIQ